MRGLVVDIFYRELTMRIAVLFIGLVFSTISLAQSLEQQRSTIAEDANFVAPLLNGQQVPEIDVTTSNGDSKSLASVLNNQKTVLFFYRGGWCPFCNTQMGQLKKAESELKALGFQLIGISTDSPADLNKSIAKQALPYQLLSDYHSTISTAFGLSFFASENVTKRYLNAMKLSNPLQKNAAGEQRLVLPVPAIYVIDSKGLVQFNYVNPNFRVRLHEELLLKAASLVK